MPAAPYWLLDDGGGMGRYHMSEIQAFNGNLTAPENKSGKFYPKQFVRWYLEKASPPFFGFASVTPANCSSPQYCFLPPRGLFFLPAAVCAMVQRCQDSGEIWGLQAKALGSARAVVVVVVDE